MSKRKMVRPQKANANNDAANRKKMAEWEERLEKRAKSAADLEEHSAARLMVSEISWRI